VKFKAFSLNNIFLFLFLYLTLIIGFIYGENLNHGSYYDWVGVGREPVKDFSNNFTYTFLNYDSYGHRHSPIYLIFLSLFLDLGLDIDQIRFFHLHLCISLIVIFYQCLRLKFTNINNNYLFLLSLIIFLSPTFRSLAIWPDSRIPGLIFFVLTIYFFLKFKKKNELKYTWYTCVSLVISSYISPNFSIFFPYFFSFFLKKVKFKALSFLIIFNFLALLPILYYIFILDVNFLFAGRTPAFDQSQGINSNFSLMFNLADKALIISSIILFHLLPLLMNKETYINFFQYIKKNLLKILLLFLILAYFFGYQVSYTGGGFIFQLSHMLFNNNYLFFGFSFLSLSLLMYFSKLNLSNFWLFILLIVSNIQNSIYHKYYEPLILILFFTLFKNVNTQTFFKKKHSLVYLYLFSLGYIFLRFFHNFYLR